MHLGWENSELEFSTHLSRFHAHLLDFIEIRESHFTAKSLRMLFKDISPEKICNFFKEINILGKI